MCYCLARRASTPIPDVHVTVAGPTLAAVTDASASGRRIAVVDYLVLGDDPHLEANACTGCGALFFDRRNACARCGQLGVRAQAPWPPPASSGRSPSSTGPRPDVPVPYVSSVIELDGGGVVKANLVDVGADPEKIELGMKVA